MLQTLCKAVALVLAVSHGVLGAYPSGNGPAVAIKSITQLGNMTDGNNVRFSRDGGAVGSVGGVNMWIWSDTNLWDDTTGAWKGFFDSTTSVSNITHPTLMRTQVKYGIPWTAYENAFYAEYFLSPRIVHWATSPPVEVSPGKGLLWVKRNYYGSNPKNATLDNVGMVLCNVTIKADGTPMIQRVSGDVPVFAGILYGNMGATKDDKHVFLYGTTKSATFIARAPIAHADNVAQFEYFHNDTQKWTSVAPLKNATSAAIISGESLSWSSFYYSTYHQMWLNIYSYSLSMQVYYRTALQPQGPWVNRTLVYTAPPTGKNGAGYIYGTQATNIYDPTGKSALVDFSWFYGDYANWVFQINWA